MNHCDHIGPVQSLNTLETVLNVAGNGKLLAKDLPGWFVASWGGRAGGGFGRPSCLPARRTVC